MKFRNSLRSLYQSRLGSRNKFRLSKFLPIGKSKSRKPIPKKRTRPTVRNYENGIKKLGPGRYICATPEAWEKQKDRLYERSGGLCEGKIYGMRCGREIGRSDMQTHHKRKQSLCGGDQMTNLLALCDWCHFKHHTEGEGK